MEQKFISFDDAIEKLGISAERLHELREQGLTLPDAVRRGCELRLRPVLMTAFTTILAIIPLLLSTGVGAETQRPLASVVIGGLFTSTLLTLVLLPVIYEWVESRLAV